MNKNLVIEEINRINFLMNFDSNKLVTEQKKDFVSESFLFEQVTPQKQPQPTKQGQTPQQGQQQLTPEQIKAAKQKIQQQATQTANSIFQELMKAFDLDGDKVINDYDGTNEGLALAAIKKIKNKETLEALNKRIAMTKQYPNLKSWLNAEMSDFDNEYGAIWDKLEKMGYAGANRNTLLKFAGQTGVGQLIKSADKAIDALRSMTFEQIMEGFREIVTGVAGTIGTLILSVLPGGQIANMVIFGVLTAWDIYQFTQKKGNWFNFIFDSISVILAGVAQAMTPAKAAVAGEQTAVGFFGKLAAKFPKIFGFFSKIGGKIVAGANKIAGLISEGVAMITKAMPFLAKFGRFLTGMIGKLSGFLTAIEEAIAAVGAKLGGNLIGKGVNYLAKMGKMAAGPLFAKAEQYLGKEILMKLEADVLKEIEKYIAEKAKNATIEQSRKLVCSSMAKKYCQTFDIVATGLEATELVTQSNKSGTEVLHGAGELQKAEKGLEKLAHGVEAGKAGVESIEKGTEAIEKGKEEVEKVGELTKQKPNATVAKAVKQVPQVKPRVATA